MVIESKGMLLSTKEASERLDVSARRVRELAAKGTLESVGGWFSSLCNGGVGASVSVAYSQAG